MGDARNDGRMKVYVCHVNTNDKKSRTVQFLFFVFCLGGNQSVQRF